MERKYFAVHDPEERDSELAFDECKSLEDAREVMKKQNSYIDKLYRKNGKSHIGGYREVVEVHEVDGSIKTVTLYN